MNSFVVLGGDLALAIFEDRIRKWFEPHLSPGEVIRAVALADNASKPWLYEVGQGEFFYSSFYVAITDSRLLLARASSWFGIARRRAKFGSWPLSVVDVEEVRQRPNGDSALVLRIDGETWRQLNIHTSEETEAEKVIDLLTALS